MGTTLTGLRLAVRDVAASVAFYRDALGIPMNFAGPNLAQFRLGEATLLLVSAAEAPAWLGGAGEGSGAREGAGAAAAGPVFSLTVEDVRAKQAELAAREVPILDGPEDQWWGMRELVVADPDGHPVCLQQPIPVEDLRAAYLDGGRLIREALAGLSEADLDLARAPGKWTIRQLALHMVDSNLAPLFRLTMALAEPGREWAGNFYNQDLWADRLAYARRPLEPALEYLEALREHVVAMLDHLPADAWERHTLRGPARATVRQAVELNAFHVRHHVKQVWATRRAHGK